jgi:hypothetical protein
MSSEPAQPEHASKNESTLDYRATAYNALIRDPKKNPK